MIRLHLGARRVVKIRVGSLMLHVALLVGALIMLFPVLWMFVSAFKPVAEITAYPPTFLPRQPTLATLRYTWTTINLKLYFLNSLIVAAAVVPISVLTSAWVGFVLEKYEFRGKTFMFYAILATMMIPPAMLLIPTYQVALWLRLINSYQALIIPGLFTAFGIFMMRQAMGGVPAELLDAARIDGASEPRVFLQIALPLVRPSLATLAILQFLASWDNFLWPLVVTTSERLYTLPIGLALFGGESDPGLAYRNAGAFITVAPLILVFAIFQRQIIRSIALTGLKA